MVGLVVVGHSRALARAAVALASEMVQDKPVPIEVAAGLDDTTFGTDATAIMAAIISADQGDGVVVLMDLGSAVLSTELALELLADDVRERVVLSAAPFVEGLVAAVVSAAAGADRAEIAAEAASALAGKAAQLGVAPGAEGTPSGGTASEAPGGTASAAPEGTASEALGASGGPASGAPGPSAGFTVINPHGLHARPAARLVAAARAFDAEVELRNLTTGSAWVPAGSLSRVATLGALAGHSVEVRATGPQAREAVDALVALAGRAFDEAAPSSPAPASVTSAPASGASVPAPRASASGTSAPAFGASAPGTSAPAAVALSAGRPASPGIGTGPVWHLSGDIPEIPDLPTRGAAAERQRLDDALSAVRSEVKQVRAGTARDVGAAEAEIFDAHLLLLDDGDLLADVRGRIDAGEAAPPAWVAETARIAASFEALDDPYLRARAADVRAVGDQVLRALLGVTATTAAGSGVLVAADLTPADAAALDPARVAGVLLAFGSPTSHGAILARTRGVPAVVGLGPSILQVPDGTSVVFDGGTGEVVVAPDETVLSAFQKRAAAQSADRSRAAARSSAPAVTRDGVTIAVGANLGSLADARAAAAAGADLAGLVRTEFLFLDRDAAPDVDEQEATYRAIAEALAGRRITLRTLDVGGDKPLRYLPGPAEDNPFLGVRGLRHSLVHPDLLTAQLRAMLRVARDFPINIMFPMVSAVDEVIAARALLDAAGPHPPDLRVGIMMEVPAAALKAAAFAPYVDFVSVGTNDLTQYTLAAERGNPALAALADGLDPGVLQLIATIGRAAAQGDFEVAVCGELAGDPLATPILTGLGVHELSMAPPAIPTIKEAVRALDLTAATTLAAEALAQPSAAAVRNLVRNGRVPARS
jgi:phosphoenolpyruvate-protein phosphotransferase/dihydroxyacetone kinase phosphotransfer subunit